MFILAILGAQDLFSCSSHASQRRLAMSRRSRSDAMDLDDADAVKLFSEYVKLQDCKKELLFKYSKTRHGQAPAWGDLWRSRHMLTDLISMTKGRLLRMVRFERQLERFLHDALGQVLTADEVSRMASRPRLMLSHLWSTKRRGAKVPAQYAPLQALVNGMNCKISRSRSPASRALEEQDMDFRSSGDDDVACVSTPAARALRIDVSSGDEDVDKTGLMIDALYQSFFKESECPSGSQLVPRSTPTRSTASTPSISTKTPAISMDELASMAALGGRSPTARDYKAADPKAVVISKRPAGVMKRPAGKRQTRKEAKIDDAYDDDDDALDDDDTHIETRLVSSRADQELELGSPTVADRALEYDPMVNRATNRKRIHSRAWHAERSASIGMGFSESAAKERAARAASRVMALFQTRYAMCCRLGAACADSPVFLHCCRL